MSKRNGSTPTIPEPSLIGAAPVTDAQWLPVEAIEPSPYQYRTNIPEQELAELTASIKAHGVLQPILVRPVARKTHKGIRFQLVAGHRRHLAAQAAGLEFIPCIVRQMSDVQSLEIALTENLQREDPDDWATAQGIKKRMEMGDDFGEPLSERAMARRLGMSVGYVRNYLGLFKLRPRLQEVAQRHNAVKSSLFEIQKLNDPEIEDELIEAIDKGASFKAIQARVEEHLKEQQWKRESYTPDKATRQAMGKQSRRRSEAEKEVSTCLAEAERHLMNAAAWAAEVSGEYFSEQVAPRLERLKKKIRQLER